MCDMGKQPQVSDIRHDEYISSNYNVRVQRLKVSDRTNT